MSREINFDKELTQDEVEYLKARDDSRLANAKLPKDTALGERGPINGTSEEPGLDFTPVDEDESLYPEGTEKPEDSSPSFDPADAGREAEKSEEPKKATRKR